MGELSQDDIDRIRKAKVLERFSSEKKSHVVAVGLCVLLGFTGVHRFYLGQIAQGVAALLIGSFFLISGVLDVIEPYRQFSFGGVEAFIGYGLFLGIESFLTNKATDRVNYDIKQAIEADIPE